MEIINIMNIDYDYLCRVTANLAGIPVRVYHGDDLLSFHSPVALPVDPVALVKEQLWEIQDHVGYFLTDHFYYYGILNAGDYRFIVGPTRQLPASAQELREFAFLAGVSKDDAEDFTRGIRAIVNMPVESLLLMLCSINYMVNGEKLELKDLTISTGEQEGLNAIRASQVIEKDGFEQPPVPPHNSYSQEQAILRIVRRGDTAALRSWMENAPAIRGGIVAADQLRQMKNIFIVTATLVSRAAIRGGLDVEDAFSLSDYYIQSCERLDQPEKIVNLQYHMVLDYTEKVEKLHLGGRPGKLSAAVANYVQHHLSEVISTEELARSLYMSRTYLSAKFRDETGMKLAEFIAKEKTEEAKRLLRYTERSAADISDYLGYSSPAHFTRVFKKYTGQTPAEYRAKRT